jgi:hypothetical protein
MTDNTLPTALHDRLTGLETGLKAVVGALGQMLSTLHQQTNLLSELAAAAREEPGESPVVKSLDELTEAVVQVGAGVQILHQKIDDIPGAITSALEPTTSAQGN